MALVVGFWGKWLFFWKRLNNHLTLKEWKSIVYFVMKIVDLKNKTALLCAIGALLLLSIYYIDIFDWSGVTMSGGHNSKSYIYINSQNDPGTYMENARGILDGTWPKDPYFRAPLYSYFLAFCIAVSDSVAWVAFVQIVFAAAIAWLLCKVSTLLFSPKTGLAASVMLMLYGGFVFITVVLHTAIMECFFALLAFYSLCLLRKNFNYKNAIFAGVTAAFAGLIRPNYLLICPMGIVFAYLEYLLSSKNFKKEDLFKGVKGSYKILLKPLLAMLVFFIILSPFVIRNNLNSEKPVFLTTNAGITWRQSNSYDSHPCGIVMMPSKPLMPVLSTAFWKHQLNKTSHYMKSVEVPQNVNYYIFLYYSWFLKFLPLNFGLINALFIASLVYFYRDWKKLWPVYIYTIGYALTIIAFNITGRYRLPAVPMMLIPTAAMILDILKHRSVLKTGRAAITGAVFLGLLIYSEPLKTADNFNSWGNQARRSMFALNLPEYRFCVSRMLKINPNDRNARMTFATASAMIGDYKNVEEVLLNESKMFPEDEYLKTTLMELEIFRAADNINDNETWFKYLNEAESIGHLAGQYKLYLKTIQKRETLGLEVYVNHKDILIKSMK